MTIRQPTFYCIGHKEPAFRPHCDFLHISPNRFPHLDQMVVPDDSFGESNHGSILSEYTQLMALHERLKDSPPDDYFYMFQYRKFISVKQGRQRATSMPYAYACQAEEAEALFPTPAEIAALNGRLLLPPALGISSVANNYARYHVLEDFTAFMISLSRTGHFDEARCKRFINCNRLIPSSSIGLHKVGIFVRHMDIMMAAWRHFAEHFHQKRKGVQRRSGGFLLERLQSFLMYEEITAGQVSVAPESTLIVVSDGPDVRSTR